MTSLSTRSASIPVSKRKILRDMSKCILCGRCRNFCPTGAIKFTVEEKGRCTHCNLCSEVCPVKAIDSFEGRIKPEELGHNYTRLQSYIERKVKVNCVTCMQCYEKCPVGAIMIEDGKPFIRKGDAHPSIINCSLCSLCVKSCPTGALTFQTGRVKLNPDLCVLCGECVRVCPPQTMILKERYPGGYCVMCGRCVKSCPVGALSIKQISWDGTISEDCIRCGTCNLVCPEGAISFNPISDKKPIVDVSKCILCELCAASCPANAIPIRCSLPERRVVQHQIRVNREMCIGCSLCVDACKLVLKGDHAPYLKEGLAYIDEKKCIGCGACASICPTDCIRLVKVYDRNRVSGRASEVLVFP
ncbi:MAG: 4Fe-4S binding protein [Candidatus Verstraetearchaeota archaeon]|nr:4Fe-4S binding protein [Candidatus Verstraetearchaeota archaeon]